MPDFSSSCYVYLYAGSPTHIAREMKEDKVYRYMSEAISIRRSRPHAAVAASTAALLCLIKSVMHRGFYSMCFNLKHTCEGSRDNRPFSRYYCTMFLPIAQPRIIQESNATSFDLFSLMRIFCAFSLIQRSFGSSLDLYRDTEFYAARAMHTWTTPETKI